MRIVAIDHRDAALLDTAGRSRALARAISSTLSKYSRWTGSTVVTMATCGRTILASGSISPAWFMPISKMPKRAERRHPRERQRNAPMIVEGCRRIVDLALALRAPAPAFPWSRSCRRCRSPRRSWRRCGRAPRDRERRAPRGHLRPGRSTRSIARARRADPRRRPQWRRRRASARPTKSWPSKRSPANGEERVSRRERAAVDRDAGDRTGIRPARSALDRLDQAGERPERSAHAASSAASAASTT